LFGQRCLHCAVETAVEQHVRFTPESGHHFSALGYPLCANSGHRPQLLFCTRLTIPAAGLWVRSDTKKNKRRVTILVALSGRS
jgi:hypothetical protein